MVFAVVKPEHLFVESGKDEKAQPKYTCHAERVSPTARSSHLCSDEKQAESRRRLDVCLLSVVREIWMIGIDREKT
jgi:hypothetical protein